MGLESVKVIFIKENHTNGFEKNGYDLLGYYMGALEEFIFILDENMNLVILDSNNVQVIQNAICYGWENKHTESSIELFDKLKKYFNAADLLKSIMRCDIDSTFNVNKDYLRSHIEYYNNKLKDSIE